MAEYVYEVRSKLFRSFESVKEDMYEMIDRWIDEDYYNGTPEEKANVYARDRAEWREEVAAWDENAPQGEVNGWPCWRLCDTTCYKREIL